MAFPFGVKPSRGFLIRNPLPETLNHMVLWGKNGLDVGPAADFFFVAFASLQAAAVVVLVCVDVVAFVSHG